MATSTSTARSSAAGSTWQLNHTETNSYSNNPLRHNPRPVCRLPSLFSGTYALLSGCLAGWICKLIQCCTVQINSIQTCKFLWPSHARQLALE